MHTNEEMYKNNSNWIKLEDLKCISDNLKISRYIIDTDNKLLMIYFTVHENNCLKMMDTSDTVFVMYVFSRLNGACN